MGSNGGTGQPYFFRCPNARKLRVGSDLYEKHGIKLTGRTKPNRGKRVGRMTPLAREYTCACGHTGWSAHVDLAMHVARVTGGKR